MAKAMTLRQKMANRKKRKFLVELSKHGNVSKALEATQWSHAAKNQALKKDKEFAERHELALERACDMLENEARRRAVDGYEDVVVYQGKVVYHTYPPGHPKQGEVMLDFMGDPIPVVKRQYSDRLLELLLKAARPEKFRENIDVKSSHTGGVLVVGMMGAVSEGSGAASWEEEAEMHQAKYRASATEEQKALDAPVEVIPPDPTRKFRSGRTVS